MNIWNEKENMTEPVEICLLHRSGVGRSYDINHWHRLSINGNLAAIVLTHSSQLTFQVTDLRFERDDAIVMVPVGVSDVLLVLKCLL